MYCNGYMQCPECKALFPTLSEIKSIKEKGRCIKCNVIFSYKNKLREENVKINKKN